MEFEEYSDEELLEAGREAIKREHWPRATTLFSSYVGRFSVAGRDGAGFGARELRALPRAQPGAAPRTGACKRGPASPIRATRHIYWCLSQLHLLGGSRKEAIDAVERGFRAVPDNFLLLRLRKRLGVRQPPPIPFLDRHHGLNVRLGRLMHRIKGHTPAVLSA